jgi:hypothetical protein
MVGLFAFEFIEGNTVTRLYFMRMRRLTRTALTVERITPELARARGEVVPTFTHFLDLPILFVIIALGAMQPASIHFRVPQHGNGTGSAAAAHSRTPQRHDLSGGVSFSAAEMVPETRSARKRSGPISPCSNGATKIPSGTG